MRFAFGLGLTDLRGSAPAAAPWSPADEGAAYVWEASALTAPALDAGVTRLPDANGGPITLSAKDALAGSQPAWSANFGDGMPSLGFTVTNGSQHLKWPSTLSLHNESLFLLFRPGVAGNWGGAFGIGLFGSASFQISGGSGTEFRGVIASGAPIPAMTPSPATNYADTWVTAVLELDATGGQARWWLNGALAATAAYAPAAPFDVTQITLASTRQLSASTPMQFAHGFLLHRVGDDTRAKGVAYLRRLWGARVQGWA